MLGGTTHTHPWLLCQTDQIPDIYLSIFKHSSEHRKAVSTMVVKLKDSMNISVTMQCQRTKS